MTSWANRAKTHFSQKCQTPTPKTPITTLSGVLGVSPDGFCEKTIWVSGALGVPPEAKNKKKHFALASENNAQPLPATDRPDALLSKLLAARLALDALQLDLPPVNPDADCWPQSSAANTAELETLAWRATDFERRGLSPDQADQLADAMLARDRDADDRIACLECQHLRSVGSTWCCTSFSKAMLTTRELAREFTVTLQRCAGYHPRST